MGTAQDALNLARIHVGYREGPRKDQTKFGAAYGVNFQPWCGSFVKWCLDNSGTKGEPSPIYTPTGVQGYKAVNRWIPRNGAAQPGDLVFYDFQGGQSSGGTDHVGIVEAVLPDGRIQAIEGNTSSGQAGSQSSGNGVYRRVRSRGVIVGFGRPRYTPGPVAPAPGPGGGPVDWAAVRRLAAAQLLGTLNEFPKDYVLREGDRNLRVIVMQRAFNVVTRAGLKEDGDFGPATKLAVQNFQKFFKMPVTGVFAENERNLLGLALFNITQGKG